MTGSSANKEQAEVCLNMAKDALAAGDFQQATRLGEKAMRMHPHDEARKLMMSIKARTASSAGASSSGRTSSNPPLSNGVRHRTAAPAEEAVKDASTPEQRQLVQSIISKQKDFYQVLGITRTAGEDEIKKAYRKLALKLHPDKNKAQHADEAFKVVSKAFACLSDSDKRAAYDRYGEDAPGLARTRSQAEFDPNDIFSAFFGTNHPFAAAGGFGGPFSGGPTTFRANFGPRAGQPQQGNFPALLTVLPLLGLLLFMFFTPSSEPVFTLDRTNTYVHELVTARLQIPFYVKSSADFQQKYPTSSAYRLRMDREIEAAFEQRLGQLCYNERVAQHHQMMWGNTRKAQSMELRHCKEYDERFGGRPPQPQQRTFAF